MKKNLFLGKWLLVAIILMISSPLSIGRGGGGSGGGGGGGCKKNCNCPLTLRTTDVYLDFTNTASNMPTAYTACGVPDIGSSFTTYGGNDENTYQDVMNKYSCYVVVTRLASKCKQSYKKYYFWTEPTPYITIEVPSELKYAVDVRFSEKCNNCVSGSHKLDRKYYSSFNEFEGVFSRIYAKMNYNGITSDFCN
jgi:hypothetical protein